MIEQLVIHVDREAGVRQYIYSFMELCTAYNVIKLVIVAPDPIIMDMVEQIRNIRPNTLTVEKVERYQGSGILLDEYEGDDVSTIRKLTRENTLIVGPDTGTADLDIVTPVSIPVKTSRNLWSFHAAAIGLHEANR